MIIIDTSFNEWWSENKRLFDAVLFDIDGTLISGNDYLPGAGELLAEMRYNGHPFYLLTNDGNHSTIEKSLILSNAGINVSQDEIISCGSALGSYAKKNGYIGKLFYVLGELGTPDYAELAGFNICRNPEKIGMCDGVIIGEGNYDWESNINAAFNYFIKNPDKPLIVPNPDSYWPAGPHGELCIGAGGKARFICAVLADMGVILHPVYLGKPSTAIFDLALDTLCERYSLSLDIDRKRILMLGDSMRSDMQGAMNSGLSTCLLLTGITKMWQVENIPAVDLPDYLCKGLS
ncbi:MAG: HAD-IIA family hydrolase [bacterium]